MEISLTTQPNNLPTSSLLTAPTVLGALKNNDTSPIVAEKSGAESAWPSAIATAVYNAYNSIQSMKESVGGGPLTDDEIGASLDSLGIKKFTDSLIPKSIAKFLPEEFDPFFGTLPKLAKSIGKALFGSSKHKDQIMRDRVRNRLEEMGVASNINGSHHLTLHDGSTYNIGVDGGHKLSSIDGSTRRPYNVDISHPFAHQVTGWAMGIVSVLNGGDEKLSNDFTGYMVNAALSNADTLSDARENILAILASSGFSAEDIANGIVNLRENQLISENQYQAQLAGLISLTQGTVQVNGLSMEVRLEEILSRAESIN